MPSDQLLAEICSRAYTMTPTWQAADAHVCRFVAAGAIILAWRGTDPRSLADWLHDLDAVPAEDAALGCCHAGFLRDMQAVAPPIMDALARAKPSVPIVVTGHSKGAAEALLFSAFLCASGRTPAKVVTFGSPRIGLLNTRLPALLAGVEGSDFRHGADPVPDLPLGFTHPRVLTQLGLAGPDALADHSILAYRAALAAGPHAPGATS